MIYLLPVIVTILLIIILSISSHAQLKMERDAMKQEIVQLKQKNDDLLLLKLSKQGTINRKNEIIEELENEFIKLESVLLQPDVNLSVFRMQLKKYMKKDKLSISKLSKLAKVSYNTVDVLLKSGGNPQITTLKKIAKTVNMELGTVVLTKKN